MYTSRTRTAWAGAGLLLTLTIASPVWADNVELLLSNSDFPNFPVRTLWTQDGID